MRAMVLTKVGSPLQLVDMPVPTPAPGQVLVRVLACGICRTDLHVVDGDIARPKLPLVPGHEIVGRVQGAGSGVRGFSQGQLVGIPWLGHTCRSCSYCRSDKENLCDGALFTGYHLDGGYAEFTVAEARYCFPIPGDYPPLEAAPLLCAGLIGYRSYTMTGKAARIGMYGFGAAAHIITQVAVHQGRRVFAFTRPGDSEGQEFALELGAEWAGDSTQPPPEELDAAILFAPVGSLLPESLRRVRKGGIVVAAGIHMSDIPSFPYHIMWGERVIRSVANLTRRDGLEFLSLAPRVPVHTRVRAYPLEQANRALADLRHGRLNGAAVLAMAPESMT